MYGTKYRELIYGPEVPQKCIIGMLFGDQLFILIFYCTLSSWILELIYHRRISSVIGKSNRIMEQYEGASILMKLERA